MIDFNCFNLMRYPFFWNVRTKDILNEQLKYIQWKYCKMVFDGESRHKLFYANIPVSFDIEDSSFYDGVDKVSVMYVWQVGINGVVYMGRTWEQYHELVDVINKYVDGYIKNVSRETFDEYRVIIYVHFLDHEFQFIRKRFKWSNVFSRETRSPIYAISDHIEYRDSYILSGKSLAETAKDTHTFKGIHKMIGDLDYSLKRGGITHLSRKEIRYCMLDVQILNVYIMEKIEEEGDNIGHIPLTKTGYVRRYCRQHIYSRRGVHKEMSFDYYNGIHKLTLEPDEYKMLAATFQGGYTHCNPLYVGDTIRGKIDSIDFTSSYPAVILSELYPASKGVHVMPHSQQEFEQYLKDYLSIFMVKFVNIRQRAEAPDSIIPYSKCMKSETIGAVVNNGRVDRAEQLITCVTNIDFAMLRKFYVWDRFYVSNMWIYKKGLLPKELLQCVLDFYKAKTQLKGVEGAEVEYLSKKEMLNSVYGMMVTNIVKDLILCSETGEWIGSEKKELKESIDKYNQDKRRFLFYPWGCFVTSYSRRNLYTGLLEFGKDDYIYSDTDSIKCLHLEQHMDYINRYNAWITKRIDGVLSSYGIDIEESRPVNIKGVPKQIGVWDVETTGNAYTRFKCLGAKRYICETKDNLYITIAGVSKKKGRNYLKAQQDPFISFKDNLEIPMDYSGKLTHTYIDDERTGSFFDYEGNRCFYDELSAVHLEPTTYNLSIIEEYKRYLKEIKNG